MGRYIKGFRGFTASAVAAEDFSDIDMVGVKVAGKALPVPFLPSFHCLLPGLMCTRENAGESGLALVVIITSVSKLTHMDYSSRRSLS